MLPWEVALLWSFLVCAGHAGLGAPGSSMIRSLIYQC